MNPKDRKRITLRYDGKAFDNHSMDAITVANAIKGFAESLMQADKVLNGEDSDLTVEVVAFQDGCFAAVLDVMQTTVEHVDVLAGMGIFAGTAAAKGVADGVLQHLANIKGKMVKERTTKKSVTTLTLEDGAKLEMPSKIARLITNSHFRNSVEDVFYTPFVEAGAESVTIGLTEEGENAASIKPLVNINNNNKRSYKVPDNLVVKESSTETISKEVYFTKVDFTKGTGWKAKFPDGKVKSITMVDEKFMSRVRVAKENFSSDMLFVVKFEYTKTKPINGAATEKWVATFVKRQRSGSGNKLV